MAAICWYFNQPWGNSTCNKGKGALYFWQFRLSVVLSRHLWKTNFKPHQTADSTLQRSPSTRILPVKTLSFGSLMFALSVGKSAPLKNMKGDSRVVSRLPANFKPVKAAVGLVLVSNFMVLLEFKLNIPKHSTDFSPQAWERCGMPVTLNSDLQPCQISKIHGRPVLTKQVAGLT